MKIEIYRFGTWINAVNTKDELHEWLVSNLTSDRCDGERESVSLPECLNLAKMQGYTLKSEGDVGKILEVLCSVKLEDVVKQFCKLKAKGAHYVFDCPFCEGKGSVYLSPTKQIYKCFDCGESGSAIEFIMRVKRLSFNDALKWLGKFAKSKK